ncbi:hypothetical protein BDQ17DRAFT_1349695, partial [Cyathus striatus]
LFSISPKTSWLYFCSKFRLSSRCLAAWLLLAHRFSFHVLSLYPCWLSRCELLIPFDVCYPGSMSWCHSFFVNHIFLLISLLR